MKRTLTLFAVMALCLAMMVSCKNNKKTEPASEEVDAQKVALADSVLAKIDDFADQYIINSDAALISLIGLTPEEKAVKPDYLLDPGEAPKFVTKTQKVNALAIYLGEVFVRKLYDMPTDEVEEVIAKLAVELNHPFNGEYLTSDNLPSDSIRKEYRVCKESGDLAYFWQFQNAVLREFEYLLAKNPDVFFRNIDQESLDRFNSRWNSFAYAVETLAPYDEEMAILFESIETFNKSNEDITQDYFSTIDKFKETIKNDVFNMVETRNALLQ